MGGIGLGGMGGDMLAQLKKKQQNRKSMVSKMIKLGIEALIRHVRRYRSRCYG